MPETRRKFTREFKIAAVKRLQEGQSVARLARELQVNSNQLHQWKRDFTPRPNSAFPGEGRRRGQETQVAELERKIGQQAMEIDFLRSCLRQIEDLRMSQAETARPLSAARSARNGKGAAH